MLSPGAWEGNEWGATSAPRTTRREDELRHVPAHGARQRRLPAAGRRTPVALAGRVVERRVAFLTEYQDATTRALQRFRRKRARGRAQRRRHDRPHRGRGALRVQADGLQGRVRSRAPVHQRRLPGASWSSSSTATTSCKFHLAPPLLAKKDAQGRLIKQEFGPWVFTAFKWLAKLRFLRGGAFDIFGRTDERKMERQLIERLLPHHRRPARQAGPRATSTWPPRSPAFRSTSAATATSRKTHLHKAKAREAELLKEWEQPAADREGRVSTVSPSCRPRFGGACRLRCAKTIASTQAASAVQPGRLSPRPRCGRWPA